MATAYVLSIAGRRHIGYGPFLLSKPVVELSCRLSDAVDAPDLTERALRVVLCRRGEQWIALRPGQWRVSCMVGQPSGAARLTLAEREVNARGDMYYQLVLTRDIEERLENRLDDVANP